MKLFPYIEANWKAGSSLFPNDMESFFLFGVKTLMESEV